MIFSYDVLTTMEQRFIPAAHVDPTIAASGSRRGSKRFEFDGLSRRETHGHIGETPGLVGVAAVDIFLSPRADPLRTQLALGLGQFNHGVACG